MSFKGPDQDLMHLGEDEDIDAKYRDASYLGDTEDDEEEVQDLGFIVDDHDDRRISLTDGFQRLDSLNTDEPLETNRDGRIPEAERLVGAGLPEERFATDYHTRHQVAERQEEEFVRTSMLDVDPDIDAGSFDDTDETLMGIHGEGLSTDIYGRVAGAAAGLGTSVPQDAGLGGFQIEDNPLMQPQGELVDPADALAEDRLGLAYGPDDYNRPDDEDTTPGGQERDR